MPDPDPPPSYRALLAVPSLGRLVLGMQVARVAQAMVSVAMVLFALTTYHSAELAGVVTFVAIAPGLVVSPVAGALLDRHGRGGLIVLDYLVAAGSLLLIGLLSRADLLPAWLLILIAGLSSLTAPLSNTGLRSLFPIIVPRPLWERVNALDSNGYVLATVIGPPLAGALVGLWGGAPTLILIGSVFVLAAFILWRFPDPPPVADPAGHLLAEAWRGLLYTWRNPTLRALGFSISALNLGGGMTAIVVPLLVLGPAGGDEATVGLVFAAMGVAGMAGAFIFGRLDTRDRERSLLALPMLASAAALAWLLVARDLVSLFLVMALIGFLNGPMDIAMFTLRQRRTDPAWMGRAFAVSMAFNFAGFPIGSALTGWLATRSVEAAIAFGAVACLGAAAITRLGLPGTSAPASQAARRA